MKRDFHIIIIHHHPHVHYGGCQMCGWQRRTSLLLSLYCFWGWIQVARATRSVPLLLSHLNNSKRGILGIFTKKISDKCFWRQMYLTRFKHYVIYVHIETLSSAIPKYGQFLFSVSLKNRFSKKNKIKLDFKRFLGKGYPLLK